jgi:hypothetical protein
LYTIPVAPALCGTLTLSVCLYNYLLLPPEDEEDEDEDEEDDPEL